MREQLLIGLALILLLGIGAQWAAWRYKLPSILLLLVLGFAAGPITGIISPESLQGDWVFAVVAVSVGIILFEGGLSLRIAELREVGSAVRNLITVGALVTWVLSTVAAYYVAGFSLSISVIIGSILIVTGPTVVIPLLRHVRPTGRVGAVAKWEGITIDPVGAIVAVLVLEFVLLLHEPVNGGQAAGNLSAAIFHAVEGLMLSIMIGVAVGIVGAVLLVLLLRQRLVPDYLQSAIALMVVVGVFVLADSLQHESGLLATTLMGMALANQRYVTVRRIVEFKEDLRVLLLGSLFIILSARLEISALRSFADGGNLLFLGALMLVVRPIAVVCSTLTTKLNWSERAFLMWLAPRGVVAAAVASLFSFRLQELFPLQAEALVPLIFFVIVGTVAIYGLTLAPVARWLGVAQPNPQGVLMVGAHSWAQELAQAVQAEGFRVLLVDSNPGNVRRAQLRGLAAQQANVLTEGVMEQFDLAGIGRLLALTPNDEVNSLAALNFTEMFDSAEVYQLASRYHVGAEEGELPRHLRGRPLFGSETSFPELMERFVRGAIVASVKAESNVSYDDLRREYGEDVLPAFIVRTAGQLVVVSDERSITALPGDTIIAIVERGEHPESVSAAEEQQEAIV
jgi:NhaP-type Na+/H+ or K+/H+ antiporter